jgi:1-phosphofructokinase family hexose kinase
VIRVINLSPAIDVTYVIKELVPGQSHRVQKIYKSPGGKGVNVARLIHSSGSEVELVVPLGGDSGNWIQDALSKTGLGLKTIKISAQTRTCVSVSDRHATVFNEPAALLTTSEFSEILKVATQPVETTVISGSFPNGLSENEISSLFQISRTASKNLVIDTSGTALSLAAKAGADLLKPNLEEALDATRMGTGVQAARELQRLGAKAVLLSLGEKGLSLFGSENLSAKGQSITGNPTGAGDAVTAMAALGLTANQPAREWLSFAAAAGQLAVAEPTAGVIAWEKLPGAIEEIQILEETWL